MPMSSAGHNTRIRAGGTCRPPICTSRRCARWRCTRLCATMESLIGEPMMLHLALTGWVSTERTWHQDDYLNPAHVAGWYAAVWMALDDNIHSDSGPFEYLPGSHRWPTLRRDKVISFLTEEE